MLTTYNYPGEAATLSKITCANKKYGQIEARPVITKILKMDGSKLTHNFDGYKEVNIPSDEYMIHAQCKIPLAFSDHKFEVKLQKNKHYEVTCTPDMGKNIFGYDKITAFKVDIKEVGNISESI